MLLQGGGQAGVTVSGSQEEAWKGLSFRETSGMRRCQLQGVSAASLACAKVLGQVELDVWSMGRTGKRVIGWGRKGGKEGTGQAVEGLVGAGRGCERGGHGPCSQGGRESWR